MSWKSQRERAMEDPTSLGNILVMLGWCTKDQIVAAVKRIEAAYDNKIGRYLITEGIISEPQLEEALFRQRMERGQISRREEMVYHKGQQRKGLKAVRAGFAEVSKLSHDIQELAIRAKAAQGG